ncbi:MAG: FAD-dependent oxidoreductase [Patescibacteria group bacterium]|jgi:thioredoxin reductase (NADPH)
MYDIAIIGAGPAGLSASVYASRYGLKNVVFGFPGGLTSETHEIGNWLGTKLLNGQEFAKNSEEHAKSLGAQIVPTLVKTIERKDGHFNIETQKAEKFEAKTMLLAMGTAHRRLEIEGEKKFHGRGVSYCATCDGFFFRGKTVAVIGGGDAAAEGAVFLADLASQVYLIHRRDELRAEDYWGNLVKNNAKIKIIYSTNVLEITGGDKVESIRLDKPYDGSNELKVDGVFIEIGAAPNIELLKLCKVDLDEGGYVIIDTSGKTSIKGIWAAGDLTTGSDKFRQIVTAASEGAIAAHSIKQFLKGNNNNTQYLEKAA